MAASLLASPALAGTYTPPKGCTGFVTIQMLGCTVSNHYTCAGDASGDQWRADFGQNGMVFQSRINHEAEWVESFDFNPNAHDVLEPGSADPASFSTLTSVGEDTYDFTTIDDDGVREHVTGFDRLTGTSVVIDGVALEQTGFDALAVHDDGTTAWHSKGREFIDRSRRIFISGKGEWEGSDGAGFLPYDSSPLSFTNPGEPGFFTTTPLFGCDDVLSQGATPTLISAGRGERR